MAQKTRDDIFLEKVILFLIVLVGVVIIFNQFQFYKLSSNTALNIASFALIIALIVLVIWVFISKEKIGEHSKEHEHTIKTEKKPFTFYEKLSFSLTAIVAVMVVFNQFQISQANSLISGTASPVSSFVRSVTSPLKLGSGKSGVVIGPQLNTDGRTTKLVEWPTISETPAPKATGDPTQDAIAAVIPTGTPSYVLEGSGSEKISGATFDDPITSQKVWASLLGSSRFGKANELKLTAEEDKRWKKITGMFTCDYCCGGPNSVTIITRCGCAHSYAWQGMAKFFVKYYPQYTDEQIMGEMTKWKAIWYPQGMLQDYLVYTGQQPASILTHGGSVGIKQQFMQQDPNSQQQTQASTAQLNDLPSMVGGC